MEENPQSLSSSMAADDPQDDDLILNSFKAVSKSTPRSSSNSPVLSGPSNWPESLHSTINNLRIRQSNAAFNQSSPKLSKLSNNAQSLSTLDHELYLAIRELSELSQNVLQTSKTESVGAHSTPGTSPSARVQTHINGMLASSPLALYHEQQSHSQKNKLEHLQWQNHQSAALNQTLQQQMKQKNQAMAHLESDNRVMREKVESQAKEITNLQTLLHNVKNELSAQRLRYQEDIATLSGEVEALNSKLFKTETRQREKISENKTAHEKPIIKENANASKQAPVASNDSNHQQKAEISRLNHENKQLLQKLSALQGQLKESERKFEASSKFTAQILKSFQTQQSNLERMRIPVKTPVTIEEIPEAIDLTLEIIIKLTSVVQDMVTKDTFSK